MLSQMDFNKCRPIHALASLRCRFNTVRFYSAINNRSTDFGQLATTLVALTSSGR